MRMYLSLALAIVLALTPPLAATMIEPHSLGRFTEKGKVTDFSKIGTGPCNYLYASNDDLLLYYGTSGNCRQRIQSHNLPIVSASEVVAEYKTALRTAGCGDGPITKAVRLKAIEASEEPAFGSDECIGIVAASAPLTIYVREFQFAEQASEFEQCVLGNRLGAFKSGEKGIQGNCNRTTTGRVNASAKAVSGTINACEAWIQNWKPSRKRPRG